MTQTAEVTEAEAEPQLTSPVTAKGGGKPPGEPEVLDVGDMLTPDMPPVQQHSIDAARAAQAKVAESAAPTGGAQSAAAGSPVKGRTDELGRDFNASIHEIDGTGNPAINAKGYLKRKRGGAGGKPQASASNSFSKSAATGPDPKTAKAVELDAKIASNAQVSAMLFIVAAQMIGGEEMKPDAGEPEQINDAFTAYYRIRGIVDLPPEVVLAVTLGGFVAKRWNMPIFSKKRSGWWEAIKAKLFRKRPVDDSEAGGVDTAGSKTADVKEAKRG